MSKQPDFIQEKIQLAPYTTMHIGGPAQYLAEVKTTEDIVAAMVWARDASLPVTILGIGGNVLISDQGIAGLVLIMQNDEVQWNPPQVIVGAGLKNGQLIAGALAHGLGGLSWLAGVPGTVGGSLYGNAGGHGWGLGDQVEWVEVLRPDQSRVLLSKDECEFAYRSSIFKSHRDWIILQARLRLVACDAEQERQHMATILKEKNVNQPANVATSGCMFKNPVVERLEVPTSLQPHVATDGTIAAWRLIDEVGLRGRQLGQMEISSQHANFMFNRGGATADEVVQLVSLVKQQVRDTLHIQLQEEIQYLGF